MPRKKLSLFVPPPQKVSKENLKDYMSAYCSISKCNRECRVEKCIFDVADKQSQLAFVHWLEEEHLVKNANAKLTNAKDKSNKNMH